MVASLLDIHPAVIAAVRCQAELQATLVGECLKVLAGRFKQDGVPFDFNKLPVGALLELGAICQLMYWEMQGFRAFLPSELPTFKEAANDLHHRAMNAPEEFASIVGDHLGLWIQDTWLERFSWNAPKLLEADIVLGDIDEDALVEAVANLLWERRHNFLSLK